MQLAIETGSRRTNDRNLMQKLQYVNAHATGTQIGDSTEMKAVLQTLHRNLGDNNYKSDGDGSERVKQMIASNVRMSSTKSSIGHMLGASGAIESALTLQALRTGIAPPTKNLDDADDIVPKYMNCVPNEAQ